MDVLHEQGEPIRDRYQIVALLGQESMGDTYSAIDLDTSQYVAIKVVSKPYLRSITIDIAP
ncbi:MAG: hypothetical protein AB4290_12960 [Spirulina sp.]